VSGIADQNIAVREDVESGVVVVIDFHYGAEFGLDTVLVTGSYWVRDMQPLIWSL
jgi:hypothetical protein